MLERYKQVFEALPHVTEIWVTDDGEFHLHPHNGGKHILKADEVEAEIKPETETKEAIEIVLKEIKPEIKVKEAAKIVLKDQDKATETVLNLNK